MTYIVVLTGGIGSGKSTIATAFMQLGITVIDADIIARQVVRPGTLALKAILDHFGMNVINIDGTLNRRLLRKYIFSSSNERDWLNSLLHPLIYKESQRQIAQSVSPYVIWTLPLFLENPIYKKIADRILVVDITPELQIQRTMIRDNISIEQAKRILSAQPSRDAYLAVADDTINNKNPPYNILSNVTYLHAQYLNWINKILLQK